MARRASSSLHPGIILGIVAAIVVAVVAGKSFLAPKSSAAGNAETLRISEFLENGNSLQGNEYSVEGKIDQQLRWTASNGQVVSLRVNTPAGEELIGVEIPPKLSNLNIEREQRYVFRVKFRKGGIAVATDIRRL